MHVIDAGTGVPLVMLHAFPLDSRMWDGVRDQLARHVRVITPDQRGFGRSPLPPGGGPSVDVLADDVLALLDELSLERVVLGGCSMGGYVAMAVLRKAAERVDRLVLVDTRPDADDFDRRAGRLAAATRVEEEGMGWVPDTLMPGLLAAGTPDRRADLVGAVRAMIVAQPANGTAWALRAMAERPDSHDVLRAFDRPALVVVGERDALSPPQVARQLTELLPDGELVEIPGAGHLTPVEAPDEVAAAILNWLD
jgi:pimeloyl-ACP methyl ester carboxylesterase